MPKEPTNHQISARLAYNAQTPAFLRRMQNRVSGQPDEEDDDEFEDDGSGRPPIPRRPAIPERPDDDPGSAEEDDGDEAPQIVVLREGKHLSGREVENEKRKAKGLPPLPDESFKDLDKSEAPKPTAPDTDKSKTQSLSFSSGPGGKPANKKRKVLGDGDTEADPPKKSKNTKKPKKAQKKLLSFGDDT